MLSLLFAEIMRIDNIAQRLGHLHILHHPVGMDLKQNVRYGNALLKKKINIFKKNFNIFFSLLSNFHTIHLISFCL